jgi:hypothetical protein
MNCLILILILTESAVVISSGLRITNAVSTKFRSLCLSITVVSHSVQAVMTAMKRRRLSTSSNSHIHDRRNHHHIRSIPCTRRSRSLRRNGRPGTAISRCYHGRGAAIARCYHRSGRCLCCSRRRSLCLCACLGTPAYRRPQRCGSGNRLFGGCQIFACVWGTRAAAA